MGRFDKNFEKNEMLRRNTQQHCEDLKKSVNEMHRVKSIASNAGEIIDNLDAEFENMTKLSSRDVEFLFFATALQCCRWILQPKINPHFSKVSKEERHDSGRDGYLEFKKGKEIAGKNMEENVKSRKYPDKVRMFEIAVPYDAMAGTEHVFIPGVSEVGKNINGLNHHAATLGHDPILGYFFGTINILTRTITFKDPLLSTNIVHLHRGSNRDQYVGQEIGFSGALERTIETAREDISRIPAAVVRQALHMQSDKYTKAGLPIPFISANKAQSLLEQGWNSYEMERLAKFLMGNTGIVGIQAMLSILINLIIETIYMVEFGSSEEQSLVLVKNKKIIMYSNSIASGSNILYTLLEKDLSKLDLGGIAVTLYRLINDRKLIKQIKQEFLEQQFYNIVMGTN